MGSDFQCGALVLAVLAGLEVFQNLLPDVADDDADDDQYPRIQGHGSILRCGMDSITGPP